MQKVLCLWGIKFQNGLWGRVPTPLTDIITMRQLSYVFEMS